MLLRRWSPVLATMLAVLILATPAAATAAPIRDGGDAGCVTRGELRQARHGMVKARVHRILGTRGRLVYVVVHNEEKRAYRMCHPDWRLTITYLHGELGYKHLRKRIHGTS